MSDKRSDSESMNEKKSGQQHSGAGRSRNKQNQSDKKGNQQKTTPERRASSDDFDRDEERDFNR